MHHFYLPPDLCGGDLVTLAGAEAHHALHVRRIQINEPVSVLDGMGHELSCVVQSCTKDKVQLHVKERRTAASPPCQITLIPAVPRGKLIEDVIEKATELGAARIIPLLTDRVATRLDAEQATHKAEKWQHVAIEALKQCGAAWLPKVETPVSLTDFLSRGEEFELSLVGALIGNRRHPRDYFAEFRKQHGHPPRSLAIWIGPEGDFTPEELAAIIQSGASPITLGQLVLRTDTAAYYCLSFANYELQAAGT